LAGMFVVLAVATIEGAADGDVRGVTGVRCPLLVAWGACVWRQPGFRFCRADSLLHGGRGGRLGDESDALTDGWREQKESEMQHDDDDDRHPRVWTPEAVRRLGMTTDIETAAILGIGRTLAVELARNEQFPVRLLRMGRRISVPVADLLGHLGVNAGKCIGCTKHE
jgi:hypothetical protein